MFVRFVLCLVLGVSAARSQFLSNCQQIVIGSYFDTDPTGFTGVTCEGGPVLCTRENVQCTSCECLGLETGIPGGDVVSGASLIKTTALVGLVGLAAVA